jgi:hypothetical protein
MIAGWTIGRLHMEGHLEDRVYEIQAGETSYEEPEKDWADHVQYGLDAVRDIVGRVWLYAVLGIAVGAAIHGYVPQGFMASIMGKDAWWSVPAAVVIGIPMYSNAAGIIPVVQALLGKGAASVRTSIPQGERISGRANQFWDSFLITFLPFPPATNILALIQTGASISGSFAPARINLPLRTFDAL